MNEDSKAYYEKVKQSEKEWVQDFIEKLPRLPKKEKEQMLLLVPEIEVDTIGKINVLVQQSKHISDKNKDIFMHHLQSVEWFDWQPGETYRTFNGHIYARMTPQWLSDALLEAYYKEAPPEERANYETQKEIDKHPRKISKFTQEQYNEYRAKIYEKYYKKFLREWKKKEEQENLTDSSTEEPVLEDLPEHIPPKIELYEEQQEGAYYQYTFNLDQDAGKGDKPLYIAEKVAPKPPKEKDFGDPMENSERLPVLNFSRQYMNNTKLSRVLTTKQIDITEDEFNLNITDKVVNLVNIWQDDHITLTNTNITPFDMAVMDATYTIMLQGPMLITPEWIVRVMSGNERVQITQKKINAVMESINKLQFVRIKVDCTEEYNAYQLQKGKKPVKFWGYESYLLPVGKVEARFDANGKKVIAYKVLEKPALYRYAEMNKQIVDVPAYLLETREHFSDTDEAVLIKRYVIKRVAQIVKRNSLSNNKVSFLWFDRTENEERGLFPELGYKPDSTPAWRKKKARIIEIVKGTLDTLVEGKAITKYEDYREDGTNNPTSPIIGYKIYYNIKQSSLPTK